MKKLLFIVLVLILSSSANAGTYQRGYYRKSSGTYVDGYYKTKSDSTLLNNYSTKGNINPYNGIKGYKSPYKKYTPVIYKENTYKKAKF